MVKRDSLKSCSLSEFGGSNPPPRIYNLLTKGSRPSRSREVEKLILWPRSSVWIEHHTPNVGVAGSNPVGAVLDLNEVQCPTK